MSEADLGVGPVVLALDFGGSKIAAAVSDLGGTRLGTSVVATIPAEGGRPNFDRGIASAKDLLSEVATRRPLAGVGAATFGLPTPDGIELARTIPGWEHLRLADELAAAFACDPNAVSVSNDVKAATAAEARSGALKDCDPGIYLNLGTGLALGIVCGGKVVVGAHGAAGEVGYNLRRVEDLDPEKAPSRLLLEDAVSGMALAAAGSRHAGVGVSAADVFGADEKDAALAATLNEFLQELNFHLVNLVIALDPARVAIGGGMVRSWQRIEPCLRAALDDFVPYPPELVQAAFPYDAPLVGAVTLGIEAASRPALAGAGRQNGSPGGDV